MLKEKIVNGLNKQINAEFFASYEYLGMSAYFEYQNLSGFAHWMRVQAQEEYGHAMKIFGYVLEVGAKVKLTSVNEPTLDWKSPLSIFEAAYKHEQSVTKSIYSLVDSCVEEKDHATNNFMQWFVREQVEEESTALKILEKIKLVGDNKGALFMLDREMAQRTNQ
jgi:ferritin